MRVLGVDNFKYNNNQISFAKQLRAKCTLRKEDNKPVPCKIYELNPEEDSDYFLKLIDKKYWEKGSYIWEMDDEFKSEVTGQHAYAMETFFGKCIGYIIVDTDYETEENCHNISFLETCPEYRFKENRTSLKYIGETLLAFATSIASKDGANAIKIPKWEPKAETFYKKNCGFKERNEELTLAKSNFRHFISQNKAHSGLNIDVVQ